MVDTLQNIAKEVKAAAEIIATVSGILGDAAGSATIEINNATGHTLHRKPDKKSHEHGAFAKLPAESIAPFQSDVFGSRSGEGAIAMGTTGRVLYSVGKEIELRIRWVVAFNGGNESGISVSGPDSDHYIVRHIIASENKRVAVRFVIGEKAAFSPRVSDWRTCGECKSLCYPLDGGRCPRNVSKELEPRTYGPHKAAGYTFNLPFGVPGPNRESAWRKCARCKALFYDGWNKKGTCSPGEPPKPGHVAETGGQEFFLPFDMASRPGQQNDWRFCQKCFALFYLPHNVDGDCAYGGRHHAHPYNYVLDHA